MTPKVKVGDTIIGKVYSFAGSPMRVERVYQNGGIMATLLVPTETYPNPNVVIRWPLHPHEFDIVNEDPFENIEWE